MAKSVRSWDVFPIKPAVSAMALVFGGVAYAEESALVLPEIQVEEQKEVNQYNPPKSANQKFTAPLIDTPKSVTVITKDVIQDTGSITFQDALRTTPGITFGSGEGGIAVGDRPYIRGFDAFSSVYVDGLRDIGAQQREIFAIEQMEVIKGPSGAYDGRGSAGGSINITTKQAKAGNAASASIGLGTDSYKRATIDGNFQLGENAAIRIVGMTHDADTPGRDHVDAKRWGVLPSITLGLDTPTQFTASWYHLESDSVPDWGLPYVQQANPPAGDGIPRGTPVGSKDTWYGVKGRDFHDATVDIGTFKIEHAFNDDVTLRNTTRYGRSTNDYALTRPNVTPAQFAVGVASRSGTPNNRDTETDTLANLTDITVKFDTGSVKHVLNAGFEISREETERRTYAGGNIGAAATTSLNNPDPNVAYTPLVKNPHPAMEAETLNRSAYVFDSIELNESWLVNAGIRYDSYRNRVKNQNVNTGAVNTEFETDDSFFNYQLGAVYRLKPNANIYATWATSTTPAGLANGEFGYAGQDLNANTEDLSPERSRTVELGTKWNVLENLDLTAAVFRTEKTNARVNAGAAIENAGEAVVKGIEFGAAGKITNKWSIFAGYTYLDAEQTKAGDSTDPNAVGSEPSKGKQLSGVAKQSASIWTTYKLLPQFTVGGGAFYMDKVYANPGNTAHVPSYVRWDAMAKYDINKNFDVQLNIQNLTDERYFSTTYFRHYAIVAPGRSGFLTLNLKY